MFFKWRTGALLIAALAATKAFAVVLGFPPSGTILQRGSKVTATWGSTTIEIMAIGLENASDIFPIVYNVDAQSFKATFVLPEFAVGDFTLALLNNVTMDLFSGNTVHIVENTTTTTSTGGVIPTSTPSPNPTSTRTSLNAGTIFVIVLGAVTAIGILGVFLVLAVRRMRTVDANVDPFERIHASEASQIQASPPPSMRFEKFRAVARDGQNNLAVQIGALRRQLENLRGVYDQPDGAVDQVGILQARIRMLEHELESLGGPEPPPEYPHQ